MADAAEAVDLDEALNVLGDFTTEVTFNFDILVDKLAELRDFFFGEITDPSGGVDTRTFQDLLGGRATNTEDIGNTDLNPLVTR